MENMQDALIMAFSVLIFVLALGLSMVNFTSARVAAQYIVDMADREYWYTEDDYVTSSGSMSRIVGVETVIPSMYRAYKENYKIIFYQSDGTTPYVLYDKTVGAYTYHVNYIDLEEEVYANQKEAVDHLNQILNSGDGTYGSLYNRLNDKKFKEKLGEYYQEDQNGTVDSTVPESNKTKKRVITYIIQ